MIEKHCCFVRDQYFIDHPDLKKVLDPGDIAKQSHRTYVCVGVVLDQNQFFIPLRNNLGDAVRRFGRIGVAIPSQSRPDAGLDFRHALLVNDDTYIEPHSTQKLPNSQYSAIDASYAMICKQFRQYVNGYCKAVRKNRVDKEPLYRDSSLVNYHTELNIDIES